MNARPDTAAPPVNLQALEGFMDTPEELREYVAVFLAQAGTDLETLSHNSIDGENRAWVQAAHRLKGSAAMAGATMAGATRLHELCAEAQGMITASAGDRAALFGRIDDAFSDVQDYFARRCAAP